MDLSERLEANRDEFEKLFKILVDINSIDTIIDGIEEKTRTLKNGIDRMQLIEAIVELREELTNIDGFIKCLFGKMYKRCESE